MFYSTSLTIPSHRSSSFLPPSFLKAFSFPSLCNYSCSNTLQIHVTLLYLQGTTHFLSTFFHPKKYILWSRHWIKNMKLQWTNFGDIRAICDSWLTCVDLTQKLQWSSREIGFILSWRTYSNYVTAIYTIISGNRNE